MIVFMAGFPFGGKSFVLQQLLAQTKIDATVIDPKSYRPDDYDKMDEDGQRDVNIAAWECTLDTLAECIKTFNPCETIIYDTACASLNRMREFFELGKEYGHRVIYAHVRADIKVCRERARAKWLTDEIVEKYMNNFRESIPALAKLADKVIVINNSTNEVPNIEKLVRELYGHDRVRQPE